MPTRIRQHREKKLYDQCRAEYHGLMLEVVACWNSCYHLHCLPVNTVNTYQENMKVIEGHWNDPASMQDDQQVELVVCLLRCYIHCLCFVLLASGEIA